MKKNNYGVTVVLFLLAAALSTCGNGLPGAEENGGEEGQGELKTWTWTEGAFALEIKGHGDYPRNGDSFSMSHMGSVFSGNISREENTTRFAQTIGRGAIAFPRPGGEPPLVGNPVDEDDGTLYFDDPSIKGAVNIDGRIVDITSLPEPVGVDEVGGKKYPGQYDEWIFNNDRTYLIHHTSDYGDYDYTKGIYTWDSETKTLLLLPVLVGLPDLNDTSTYVLMDKKQSEDFLRTWIGSNNFTDNDAPLISEGRYNTLEAFITGGINERFGLQVYNYETDDAFLTMFIRNLMTTLAHDEENRTIGGCKYIGEPVKASNYFSEHYLLDMTFEEARAKLVSLLGANTSNGKLKNSSSLTTGTGWVILEECFVSSDYRLVRDDGSALVWSRL